MAVIRKARVITALAIALALFALAAVGHVYTGPRMGTRPWHLEAYLKACLAECRTGPGAYSFGREYALVAACAEEARRSLLRVDGKWWIWRDYADCMHGLLAAWLDAQTLKLRLAQRRQEQVAKLEVLLSSLRYELDTKNHNRKIWSRFELRGFKRNMAESLAC